MPRDNRLKKLDNRMSRGLNGFFPMISLGRIPLYAFHEAQMFKGTDIRDWRVQISR